MLAQCGQLALLQGNDELLADIILGLRALRRSAHNRFAVLLIKRRQCLYTCDQHKITALHECAVGRRPAIAELSFAT